MKEVAKLEKFAIWENTMMCEDLMIEAKMHLMREQLSIMLIVSQIIYPVVLFYSMKSFFLHFLRIHIVSNLPLLW